MELAQPLVMLVISTEFEFALITVSENDAKNCIFARLKVEQENKAGSCPAVLLE